MNVLSLMFRVVLQLKVEEKNNERTSFCDDIHPTENHMSLVKMECAVVFEREGIECPNCDCMKGDELSC